MGECSNIKCLVPLYCAKVFFKIRISTFMKSYTVFELKSKKEIQ